MKYSLWERKNQSMNLNSLYLEQENYYQRLYQEVGYLEEGEPEGEQPEPDQEENYHDLSEDHSNYHNAEEQF